MPLPDAVRTAVAQPKLWLGALVLVVLVGSCQGCDDTERQVEPAASDGAAAATGPRPIMPADRDAGMPAAGGGWMGRAGTDPESGLLVADVIDGDSFRLADGREIRVLGIDSCEAGAGRSGEAATAEASRLLSGRTVTLLREPGVDLDAYRRLLRYVVTDTGRDFGSSMVAHPHTGVYEGGDAAIYYLAELRRRDDGPMSCGPLTTTTQPQPAPEPAPRPALRPAPQPAVRPASPPAPRPAPPPALRPAPPPRPAPVPEPAPRPATRAPAVPGGGGDCHPSYLPCIPDGPDLDCPQIGHSVTVVGPDQYRLDADRDGRGCE